MDRIVSQEYAEAIAVALAFYPPHLRDLVDHADFLTGTDPVFAGLHGYAVAADGRSYGATAHVAYGRWHVLGPADRRRTTVVLPALGRTSAIPTIVHELGHVLDEATGFSLTAAPVSWYARTNRREAFAEAVTSALVPGYADRPDERMLAFLTGLDGAGSR